jgi:hypothetical protein
MHRSGSAALLLDDIDFREADVASYAEVNDAIYRRYLDFLVNLFIFSKTVNFFIKVMSLRVCDRFICA